LCPELKIPHESNCIFCAHEYLRRAAVTILNVFPSIQILTGFDFPAGTSEHGVHLLKRLPPHRTEISQATSFGRASQVAREAAG